MLCLTMNKVKPYLAMVSLQFGYAGMYIITMVSLKHGMSHYILAVYRHVVATLIISPFALENKAKDDTPHLSQNNGSWFSRVIHNVVKVPVLDQNLYFLGMKYTSATFASATVNVLPAITFIMAVIFRLESVNVKKIHSLAKVIGTAITISGAMLMTLYKGPVINFIKSGGGSHPGTSSESSSDNWFAGTLMLLAGICAWSGFFILQSFTLKKYPAELSLSSLICLTGVVEGSIVSLIMERDMSAWKIGFDSKLLAVTYSVRSGLLWNCILCSSIFGAIIIVFGLYTVVWGKSKDRKVNSAEISLTPDHDEKGGDQLPITNTSVSARSMINGADDVDSSSINSPTGLIKIQAKGDLTRGT
ncbi:hypothetical protein EZV62_022134 [Acer yangbiense]|uniref:WAT1-related protein n=1 Tax=Acer yangbiense TaxID=1000413 RepID=A0A5C7H913_9ROSI|nr:hypothetical protein EZV62_022134 [Acer yangbiense]